jgi:UPF0755 protein
MLKFLGWLFAVAILLVSALAFYGAHLFMSPGPLGEKKLIVIERGSGLRGVAALLETEAVISNQWVFMGAAALTNRKATIKAGEYEFSPGLPMAGVLSKLSNGEVVKRSVTIPEGWTSYQVIRFVNKADRMTGELVDIPAEGTLLPETYHYTGNEDRAAVIGRMEAAMEKTVAELWPLRAANLPLATPEDAVVLASIVEKETGVPSERKRVAGVFINRLRQGMKLQTDPTVIYAITRGKHEDEGKGPLGRRLLRKDLENTNSPYNTYMYEGLPPGPIANPGRASIEAVLHPEDHEFLFFVADGKGGHIFAKTAKEHERNVVEWRKIRAAQ